MATVVHKESKFLEFLRDKPRFLEFLESTRFTLMILGVVGTDLLLFILESQLPLDTAESSTMTAAGALIVLFFIFEMVAKIYAMGFLVYIGVTMNSIDMSITLVTTIGFLLEKASSANVGGLSQLATMIRFVRMTRLSRVITGAIKAARALSKNSLDDMMRKAVLFDDWERVEEFLHAGANVENTMGNDGMTYLMHCAMEGKKVITLHLLEFGANVHRERESPSREVAALLDVLHPLLAAGTYVNKQTFDTQWSLLHEAVGSPGAVELLLRYKASVNITDLYERTPLHIACTKGEADSIRPLLMLGASTTAKDIYGKVARDYLPKGREDLQQIFDEELKTLRSGKQMLKLKGRALRAVQKRQVQQTAGPQRRASMALIHQQSVFAASMAKFPAPDLSSLSSGSEPESLIEEKGEGHSSSSDGDGDGGGDGASESKPLLRSARLSARQHKDLELGRAPAQGSPAALVVSGRDEPGADPEAQPASVRSKVSQGQQQDEEGKPRHHHHRKRVKRRVAGAHRELLSDEDDRGVKAGDGGDDDARSAAGSKASRRKRKHRHRTQGAVGPDAQAGVELVSRTPRQQGGFSELPNSPHGEDGAPGTDGEAE